jgi:hypothetical protein
MSRVAALALPALLFAAAAPAPAPTARDVDLARRAQQAALDAARAASDQAKAMAAESDRLAQERVTAAAGLRATEDDIAGLADRIAALQARRDAAAVAAQQRAALLAPLLPLAERLALYPAETLLTVPAPPEQAIRGVLVLQGLARELRDAVAALAADRALASATADELEAARQLQTGLAARQREQAALLDQQIADAQRHRSEAQTAATVAAGRAAAMAARADTLRDRGGAQGRGGPYAAPVPTATNREPAGGGSGGHRRCEQRWLDHPGGRAADPCVRRGHRGGSVQRHHLRHSGKRPCRGAVRRPGRLRRPVPKLWTVADRAVRRRSPCRARGSRSARRVGRTDRASRRTGRHHGRRRRCRRDRGRERGTLC